VDLAVAGVVAADNSTDDPADDATDDSSGNRSFGAGQEAGLAALLGTREDTAADRPRIEHELRFVIHVCIPFWKQSGAAPSSSAAPQAIDRQPLEAGPVEAKENRAGIRRGQIIRYSIFYSAHTS
jgi:hypothetical protein